VKLWQVVSFSEPEQLLGIARAAEEAGFHGVLVSDHLFFPGRLASRYPYSADGKPAFDGSTPFPDAWTTIAAMAAVTERLRFAKEEGGYRLELPLPHADPGAIEVAKREGALFVAAGGVRRSVPLPRPLARSALASARLAAGMLVVRFVPEPAL